MEIHSYNFINHVDDSDDWNYLDLEDGWGFSPFEQSLELTYSKGNGWNFLQNDEELIEWYDINLII